MAKDKKDGPYIVRYEVDTGQEGKTLQDHLNKYARQGYQLVQLKKLDSTMSPSYQLVLVEQSSWLGQWE
jgi:hypothetical protein